MRVELRRRLNPPFGRQPRANSGPQAGRRGDESFFGRLGQRPPYEARKKEMTRKKAAAPQGDDQTKPQTEGADAPQADEAAPAAQGGDAPAADQAGQAPAAEGAEVKDNLPPVDVAVADAGTLKKKVTVTVPRARIDAKFNEMFGELSSTALVPGFRIGHAPRKLIEKRFGKDIAQDVRNAVIGDSLGQAVEKAALKSIGEPEIDLEKIELPDAGDLSYTFEVEIAPEFELPPLENIPVTRPALRFNESDSEAYIQQILRNRAKYEVTDRPAAEGDVVTAGAKITVEGTEPVDRPGLHLRVAPGQIEGLPLVDLGKELTGKKAGETAGLSITVPEAHPTEAWRNKLAQIEIAISEVRTPVLPEFNEAFCAELGFASTDQFRQFVSQRLQLQLREQTQRSLHDQVVEYLLKNTSFEVPEGVASRHARNVLARRYMDLLNSGVAREKIDENLAQLQAQATEQAKTSLKVSFILGKVAEGAGIKVDPGEVNSRIAQMASRNNRRPERLRQELEQEGSLEELESSILEEKAIEALLAKAQITEETAAATAAREEPAKEEAAEKAPEKPKAKAHAAKADESEEAKPGEEHHEKKHAKKAPAEKAEEAAEEKEEKHPAKKPAHEAHKPKAGGAKKPSGHKKEKE
jgi:trigger factor